MDVWDGETDEQVHDDDPDEEQEEDEEDLGDAVVDDHLVGEVGSKVQLPVHHGQGGKEGGEGSSVGRAATFLTVDKPR